MKKRFNFLTDKNQSTKEFKELHEVRCPNCGKKHAESGGKDSFIKIKCKCKTMFTYSNGEYEIIV